MLNEQYLMLYHKLGFEAAEGSSIEVTIEKIADALFCTTRNAKLVLRKMEEKGWIQWKAGRGRGHRSTLAFQEDQEQLLLEAARQSAEKGEYKQAFDLLRTFGRDVRTNEAFSKWVNGHFGFHQEQMDGQEAKGALRLPVYRTIGSLDPADIIYSIQSHLVQQIFDRLVHYDSKADRYDPLIAHFWEWSEDGTVWTFHLRKGILFHDGTELTADDVKYTVDRLSHERRNSWIVRELEQVEVVATRIVRFILKKPNRIFIRFLSSVCMSIVPRHLADRQDSFQARPVGTGPFRVEARNDERLVLQANPHYFQGRPHLDQVDIVIMPEEAIHCEVSWNELLQDPDDKVSGEGYDDVVTVESTEGCTSLLTWNMKKRGPFQSSQFRRAVDLVIDRETMIRELGEYRLFPASGYIRDEHMRDVPYQYDPELAKSWLSQAGYDGTPIVMGTLSKHAKDAEWIRKQCEKIGIPVMVREEKMDAILEPDVMREMDCIVHALVLPGEEVCLVENYEQTGSIVKELMETSLEGWIRETIDKMLACPTREERFGFLNKIEDRLREEANILFLAHTRFYAHSSAVYKGMVINELGWLDFKRIWRA